MPLPGLRFFLTRRRGGEKFRVAMFATMRLKPAKPAKHIVSYVMGDVRPTVSMIGTEIKMSKIPNVRKIIIRRSRVVMFTFLRC